MIVRLWHGITPIEKEQAYIAYLRQTGIAFYKATQGNRGVYVMVRREGQHSHFLLMSLWESYDAIRAYAGEEFEKAVYYPEDKDFLVEFEPTVQHYELALEEPSAIPPSVH
jgi:hypothetical protein